VSFTKGPWHVHGGWGCIVRAGQVNVAECRQQFAEPEMLANARLIAAAPELLEVLRRYFAEDWTERHGEMDMMFQQAIKKATGE
jgi:hypothetical protein